jgi:hypothetical protein
MAVGSKNKEIECRSLTLGHLIISARQNWPFIINLQVWFESDPYLLQS